MTIPHYTYWTATLGLGLALCQVHSCISVRAHRLVNETRPEHLRKTKEQEKYRARLRHLAEFWCLAYSGQPVNVSGTEVRIHS